MTNVTAVRSIGSVAAIALAAFAALAVDPPDLEVNAMSGLVEMVDATWSGSNFNVRHTIMNASGDFAGSLMLTASAADDLDPRIAITNAGNVYVVWWRDAATDSILFRKRTYETGAWSAERPVGLGSESNSRPRIAWASGKMWVGYQVQNWKARSVCTQVIDNDPEPVRTIVATTSYSGDLDLQLHTSAGHLWASWIDTSSRVGYSEYNSDKRLWTVAAYESFASDSVAAARSRIEVRLLNP